MKNTLRLVAAAAAAAALLQLAGCATPATSQAMTVKPGVATVPVNPKLKSAIAVADVRGGKDTNPLWTSQVDAAGFRKALTDSLAIAGYLAPEGTPAKYRVSADLKSLDQPLVGFTLNVKSNVHYEIAGAGAARPYDVQATGTASTSDAFVGFERLRIANERSVMENIKEFLNRLSTFND